MVDIAFAIGNSDVNVPICWLYENNGVRQVSGVAACTVDGVKVEIGDRDGHLSLCCRCGDTISLSCRRFAISLAMSFQPSWNFVVVLPFFSVRLIWCSWSPLIDYSLTPL
jgi:hypothetical protein